MRKVLATSCLLAAAGVCLAQRGPQGARTPEAHQKAVERLLRVCYNLTPVFRVLSQFDAAEAASVAGSIGRPEFRPFAAFGVVTAPSHK